MSGMTALADGAVAALRDSSAQLVEAIGRQIRMTEPSTWMLMVLAAAALWAIVVRPPR